jgi:hypothetical protein
MRLTLPGELELLELEPLQANNRATGAARVAVRKRFIVALHGEGAAVAAKTTRARPMSDERGRMPRELTREPALG